MEIWLYSFIKKHNSTAQPDETAVLKKVECQLKEDSSVISPDLILMANLWDMHCNYVVIPKWGRYYYVNDTVFITGNRVQVSLSMDYLATHKGRIINSRCLVERTNAPGMYHKYVYDPMQTNTSQIEFQSSKYTSFNAPFDAGAGCFILRTVNASGGSNGISTYSLTYNQLSRVMGFMFTSSNFSDVISDESVKAFFNPFQYIVSLKWIPINRGMIIDSNSKETVKFGWWDSGVEVSSLSAEGAEFRTPELNKPSNLYSDWRANVSQFSQYFIYVPGIGNIDLNPADVGEALYLTGEFDIVTGMCEYFLTEKKPYTSATAGTTIIATYKCNLGIDIQIGQVSARMLGAISSGVGAMSSLLSGNFVGAASGVVNAIQSYNSPTPSINGQQGAQFLIDSSSDVIISLCNYGSTDLPTEVVGLPCFDVIPLTTCRGFYVKTSNASIQLDGYAEDTEAVNSLLDGGVFLT